jgi:hypothetical protein
VAGESWKSIFTDGEARNASTETPRGAGCETHAPASKEAY